MKLRTLIIIVIIVLVLIGVGLYFLLGRGGTNPGTPTGQTGSLPSTNNQQFPAGQNQTGTGSGVGSSTSSSMGAHFGVVANEPVLDYFINAQNHAIVVEPDGEIKTIINGQLSTLSSSTFSEVAITAFSYDGKKVVISFASGTALQTSAFDIATKQWIKLPINMQSPTWSPTSYQIAYLQPSGSANNTETIYTINAASASVKPSAVGTIAAQDMMLQWPNKTTLIVSDRPSVYAAGSAWLFNIANQTLTAAEIEKNGLETAWSGDVNTLGLIFSSGAQNSGGQLTLTDAQKNQRAIAFITLPSKCGFSMLTAQATGTQTASSSFLFCAVPRDQQILSAARLPDEYEQKVFFTTDDFYRINTGDGTLNTVFNDPNQTLDAIKLKIFNNTLFFINRYDQKLYGISL